MRAAACRTARNAERPIEKQTIDQVVDRVLALPEDTKAQIIAPCVRGRKGEHQKVLDELKREGYVRVRVDGTVYDIADVARAG